MTQRAYWTVSGKDFDSSANAFVESAKYASSSTNLKKHASYFNQKFKENIDKNMMRSGVEADNLSDAFSLQIDGNSINFVNTKPLITQRYEYGYYNGSNDTNEEYYEEYMIQTSPRYFIRPAIQETLDEIGQILLEDAKKEYNRLKEDRNDIYEG